jgi:hypothetical protein
MKFFLTSILLGISLLPASALAQNFLVGIPGIGSPTGDFDGYINAIYAMFISIAALLAVVKIVIAGVKYMFSDIVTQKSEAKKDIQGAIFGLILILGAVLILTVINPDLTNFNLEQNQIALPEPIVDQGGSGDNELNNACSNNLRCEAIPCVTTNCVSEETACTTGNNRIAIRIPPNSIMCAGTDRSWNGIFGNSTEQEVLDAIGERNIPCNPNESMETICEAERNLCISGMVFSGREGLPVEETINGQITIVCSPTLTEEERGRLADQVEENSDLLGTRIACNIEGQLNAGTLGLYWWDTETSICRTVNYSQTIVSIAIDETFLASADYTRMAEGLGAGRQDMLTNSTNNEAMVRVCNAYHGNGNRPIYFLRNGVNYQSESIGNIRYDSTSQACVFNEVFFQERTNQPAPQEFQIQ